MDVSLFPTKGNYMQALSTLKLCEQGYELLDKKRNILIREMMALINRADEIQSQIDVTFREAYTALQNANIIMGINTVEQIGHAVDLEDNIDIKFKSVMGVEIPIITDKETEFKPKYGFFRTNIALDEAYKKFHKVKELTVALAEIENGVYRLANNIKKTQKRANALKNILIPRYKQITSSIQNALEEKEREEFTRLKMIKKTASNIE